MVLAIRREGYREVEIGGQDRISGLAAPYPLLRSPFRELKCGTYQSRR